MPPLAGIRRGGMNLVPAGSTEGSDGPNVRGTTPKQERFSTTLPSLKRGWFWCKALLPLWEKGWDEGYSPQANTQCRPLYRPSGRDAPSPQPLSREGGGAACNREASLRRWDWQSSVSPVQSYKEHRHRPSPCGCLDTAQRFRQRSKPCCPPPPPAWKTPRPKASTATSPPRSRRACVIMPSTRSTSTTASTISTTSGISSGRWRRTRRRSR